MYFIIVSFISSSRCFFTDVAPLQSTYSGGYNIFIVTKENFELLATLAKGDFSLPLTQKGVV
jgi:hypothetical protein